MTESKRKVLLALNLRQLQDSCVYSHRKWVLKSLGSVLKPEFEAAPACVGKAAGKLLLELSLLLSLSPSGASAGPDIQIAARSF